MSHVEKSETTIPTTGRFTLNQARREAWFMINQVTDEGRQLSELTQDDRYQALSPADKATALRLATVTLRFAGRADWALKKHVPKRPSSPIQNLLRLGVVEIVGEGSAAHGVVNDLVAICAADRRLRPYKGLVNAVLRKAPASVEGKWGKSPVPTLPKWLRGPLTEAYGNKVIMGIEVAHSKGAPVDLSVKSDPEGWAERLAGQVLANGSVRLGDHGQLSVLPGFAEGEWWVQDAAAAMPVAQLAVAEGDRVLDLCAAPGGKTLQLANMGADVTALDISSMRMDRVQQNLDRTGLKATLVRDNLLRFDERGFDAVVLDAPCSATGTIRRHPDLPFAKDGTGISELIELQANMLNAAAKMVKSGGQLVYCTCSLLPDEGEVQVEEFLANHPDFEIKPSQSPWIDAEWHTSEGGVRLRPDYWSDLGGMDGFYFARLIKN